MDDPRIHHATSEAVPMLSDRQQAVLAAATRHHIQTGAPVGSTELRQQYHLQWSTATIRNEFARLQDLGMLEQPHTSAGRQPTSSGYRYYLDRLFQPPQGNTQLHESLSRAASDDRTLPEAVEAISREVAAATMLACVVVGPSSAFLRLQQVHYIHLAARKALAVCVLDRGSVLETQVEMGAEVDRSMLQRAANYLTQSFKGRTVAEVRGTISQHIRNNQLPSIEEARIGYALLWSSLGTHDFGRHIATCKPGEAVQVHAETDANTILDTNDGTIERLMLDSIHQGKHGVAVALGDELQPKLRNFALVRGDYRVSGENLGAVGVLGPLNIPYEHAFVAVDAATQTLNRYFGQTSLVTT